MNNKCKSTLNSTEVLGNGFELFSNNIRDIIILLLIFFLLPVIVISGISYYLVGILAISILSESFSWLPIILLTLFCIVVSLFPSMGYIGMIKMLNVRSKGEEYSWKNGVKYGFSAIGKVISLNLLIFAVVFCIGLLTFLIWLVIPSMILLLIIILAITLISIYFIFTYAAMAVHDLGVIASIKYSFNIVRGRYLNVLGKRLLVGLLAIGITILINILALIPILGALIAIVVGAVIDVYIKITTVLVMLQDYDNNGFIINK